MKIFLVFVFLCLVAMSIAWIYKIFREEIIFIENVGINIKKLKPIFPDRIPDDSIYEGKRVVFLTGQGKYELLDDGADIPKNMKKYFLTEAKHVTSENVGLS